MLLDTAQKGITLDKDIIKIREFPEHNYKAIWFNGKTIRLTLNPKEEITELKYPEFYDVKITGYCEGKCPWCYMSSSQDDQHYENIVEKVIDYFGPMSKNERPFQVAVGGGEPTSHPQFIELLRAFKSLGIEPNYTTNGMWDSEDILYASSELCGGVAVSCHPHLKIFWENAAHDYLSMGVKLNFHLIISDKESIDYFMDIYNKWYGIIDYFVLLPYTAQGRAEKKEIDWEYLIQKMPDNTKDIAFGAGFYPYLLHKNHNINVSLYEPEIMSKFLDLKDMKLYKSSFNLMEV